MTPSRSPSDPRLATAIPSDTAAAGGLGSLFFVGNATVLLRVAGHTLLTDPNFVPAGTQVPLGYGLSTTRRTEPAMSIDDLPPLDAVVLSHYHGDHFDQLAEDRLDRLVPIVTTVQAADVLGDRGFFRTIGLEPWQTHELHGPEGRVRITALPGRHAPGPLELALPDVMGSLVEVWREGGPEARTASGPDLRIYVSGDTILYEGLREIAERAGPIDLALLHLGGTRVLGVTVTMDGEQGAGLLRLVRPARAAAIHYDDYDAFKSPVGDFLEAAREAGFEGVVQALQRGETLPL